MRKQDEADLRRVLEVGGGWEGFEIAEVTTEAELQPDVLGMPAQRFVIRLSPKAGYVKKCSRCGEPVEAVHEVTERRIRDLPIWAYDTWLIVPCARLQCPRCGPTVEAIPWLDKYQRLTTRLAAFVAKLAQVLPISAVAALLRMSWDTVKAIDHRALLARVGPVTREGLAGVRQLLIDEFALHKGHRYAIVVADAATRRVLWVGRGKKREDLRPFFELLGPAGCAQIEAVGVDMSGAFRDEIHAHCPQAKLVYDLFHVVAKYAREVLDRVRNQAADAVATPGHHNDDRTRAARRVIKGTRWILLRPQAALDRADRVRLKELLRANRGIFTAYVLQADLKQLWRYRSLPAARRAWRHWYRRAMSSRIPALQTFARAMHRHLEGILNHARYPLNTSVLEGMNNKIKLIKRTAYGFRDEQYFFLKIRAAFPGIS